MRRRRRSDRHPLIVAAAERLSGNVTRGGAVLVTPLRPRARRVGVTLRYDPAYTAIAFPGGAVPREKRVCTDVIIRAYRDALGLDLQARSMPTAHRVRRLSQDLGPHRARSQDRSPSRSPPAHLVYAPRGGAPDPARAVGLAARRHLHVDPRQGRYAHRLRLGPAGRERPADHPQHRRGRARGCLARMADHRANRWAI